MPSTEKKTKNVFERARQERQKERALRVPLTKPGGKKDLGQILTSCLTTSVPQLRMSGGANDPSKRRTGKLPRTDSECQLKAPGMQFLSEKQPKVTTREVTISPPVTLTSKLNNKCDFFPKFEDKNPFRNQRTQTLYRESSAQTLAYLPEVLDKENVKPFELFSLPSVLPGDKPPGLYEAEVLERSRKRWTFRDALKANLRVLLKDAREKAIKSQYKPLLEAFEWEQWIEREEYIQECQMMRLEIVIKMFDKREKEMHSASKTRIEKACEEIEKRRQAALLKNAREYNRGMHRLEISLSKKPRKWQRQNPVESLSSPCSEFYAPLMRHGVDPARRSFVPKTERKAFDMRIDELEKKVNMNSLKCPFRTLKKWSKPKEHMTEYEQNFCNEKNLQKLFDTLKTLRTQSTKDKEAPKCLRKRVKPYVHLEDSLTRLTTLSNLYQTHEKDDRALSVKEDPPKPPTDWYLRPPLNDDFCTEPDFLVAESVRHAIEDILNSFEGTYIGWYMQFLSEEMTRLSEQRRLHVLSVLAQKERWRREAAEAGLRQRENDMRRLYEEMFQKTSTVNQQISHDYIRSILTTDMQNNAQGVAAETTSHLARQIDSDIERWLESFKLIQNPLTFVPLRMMLKDMVSPDVDAVLRLNESVIVVKHVMEDVLFPKMWNELDHFDISFTLTSDLIDRLIDNDLYLFSTDSESETPQKPSWYEAEAIVRKLIRQAVPGRRWKEQNERIVYEIYNSLVDNLFFEILNNMELSFSTKPLIELRPFMSHGVIRSSDDIRAKENEDVQSIGNVSTLTYSKFIQSNVLNIVKKRKGDKITRELENLDQYVTDDKSFDFDTLLRTEVITPAVNMYQANNDIFSVKSTLDVPEEYQFEALKGRGYRVMLPTMTEMDPGAVKKPEMDPDAVKNQASLDSEKPKHTPASFENRMLRNQLSGESLASRTDKRVREVLEIEDHKREKNIKVIGPAEDHSGKKETLTSRSEEDRTNEKQMDFRSENNLSEKGKILIHELETELKMEESERRSYENIAFDLINQILGDEIQDDTSVVHETQTHVMEPIGEEDRRVLHETQTHKPVGEEDTRMLYHNQIHVMEPIGERENDEEQQEDILVMHMNDSDIKEAGKDSTFSLAFNSERRPGPSDSDDLPTSAPPVDDGDRPVVAESPRPLSAEPSDHSTVVYEHRGTTSRLKK